MYKFIGRLYHKCWSDIVRNKTLDVTETRWEIMRSMLNDFPELRERTDRYLREFNHPKISSSECKRKKPEELLQRALDDSHSMRYHKCRFSGSVNTY